MAPHKTGLFFSIKSRLLIFSLCISLIPITIITTLYYLHARHTLKKQTMEWMTAVAESRKAHLLDFLEGKKSLVEGHAAELSNDRPLINSLRKIKRGEEVEQEVFIYQSEHLSVGKGVYSYLLVMNIMDMNGRVVASTHRRMVGKDVSDKEVFIGGSKGTNVEPFGSSPFLEDAGCICISTPIISEGTGETVGVYGNVYNLALLNEVTINRAGMGQTGEVVLGQRAGDGIVFLSSLRYSHDASANLSIPVDSTVAEPMRLALEGGSGAIIGPDYRGVDVVAAYQYIPSMGLGLVAKMDKAEAFAPLNTLGMVALIVGLVSAAAVTVVGIIFALSTSRPIKRLTETTRKFASGDLKCRAKVDRKDEIGELADSFNLMAGEIVEKTRELVRAEELVNEVAAREHAEVALLESEVKYRKLIETANDAIFVADAETGILLDANKRAEEMTGLPAEQIIGMHYTKLHPQEEIERYKKGFEDTVRKGRDTSTEEIYVCHKDGRRIPVEISGSVVELGGKKVIQGIFRDISERKRAEVVLKESEERFRSLSASAQDAIISINDEGDVTFWNKAAEKIFGYSPGEIIGEKLHILLMPQRLREDHLRGLNRFKETGQGPVVGKTLEQTAVRKDSTEFPVELSISAVKIQGRWNAIAIVRDITERTRAETERKENLEKLRKSLGGTVQALATTVEMRDPYTAGHQQRVTDLARAIATEMGLSSDRVDGIRMAGTIHDIGKIAVPAEILSKPGKITSTEFEIIMTHPQVGYDILKGIEFPWPVAEIVLQHQERVDGSGYPAGLKGDEILIEARILAVADVVEAMSSHRPYRAALGVDKALEEITRNKGVLYDSDVAEACVRVFKEKGFRFK